MQLVFTVI